MSISRPMGPPCSLTSARWALRASCRSTISRATCRAAHRTGSRARIRRARRCGGRRRKIGTSGDGDRDGRRKKEPAMTIRITSSLLVFFAAGLILTPGETSARSGRGYRAPVARAAAVARIPHANIRQRRWARNAPWYGGYGGYGYSDGGYDYYDPGYGDDYNRPYQSSSVPSEQQQPAGPKVVYP